jgi:ketosteroid isomerase-like protein
MHPVSRATVLAFYQAYASRDPARIERCLDDDVEWTISGPVDLMRFCGQHRGKAAVVALFARLVPDTFEGKGFEPKTLLVDGDHAAMLGTLWGVKPGSDRRIRYQLAHFVRFRDGKVIEFRSLIDSFDAAEQILGHAIDVNAIASQRATAGDLITA